MPLGLLSHFTEFSQWPSSPRPTRLLQVPLLERSGDSGTPGHTHMAIAGAGSSHFLSRLPVPDARLGAEESG